MIELIVAHLKESSASFIGETLTALTFARTNGVPMKQILVFLKAKTDPSKFPALSETDLVRDSNPSKLLDRL